MLILSRKLNETIVIDGYTRITVVGIRSGPSEAALELACPLARG